MIRDFIIKYEDKFNFNRNADTSIDIQHKENNYSYVTYYPRDNDFIVGDKGGRLSERVADEVQRNSEIIKCLGMELFAIPKGGLNEK